MDVLMAEIARKKQQLQDKGVVVRFFSFRTITVDNLSTEWTIADGFSVGYLK